MKFMQLIRANKQIIVSNKLKNTYYTPDKFLQEHKFIQDKKMISISPGGTKGFYTLGICSYIKDNVDLSNYIFSGASAGAWNSLFMTFNKNHKKLIDVMVNNELYKKKTHIFDIEWEMKNQLLNKFLTRDFDLERLFIGVTTLQQTYIYTDFENLEDAINCCIASSHIPFVTGSLINKYKNDYTFDGGFSKFPYLMCKKPVLHITPYMWNENEKNNLSSYLSVTDFDSKNFYERGYSDTYKCGKDIIKNLKN